MHQILAFLSTAGFLSPRQDPIEFLTGKALQQRFNRPKLPGIIWIMGMSGTHHKTLAEQDTVAISRRQRWVREAEKPVNKILLNLMHHILNRNLTCPCSNFSVCLCVYGLKYFLILGYYRIHLQISKILAVLIAE